MGGTGYHTSRCLLVYERTTRKYGERGVRDVHMEVEHAAQNVYLQAVSLGLGLWL
ncbi:MAG: nitroreductase family protein [Methanosarcinales archaeon]|nr:nitroreductase family protein [Methanosarcinales archaeon]